ncbi:MAG: class I SAM-dependent methyltransferase [Pseudomonadota bacterium]
MSDDAHALEEAKLQEIGEAYDHEAPFDIIMRDYMMRSFEPFWREGSCLQIGCSHGDQTTMLATVFDDLTVVDATAEFIEFTRRRTGDKPIDYVRTMVEDYKPAKRFDNIVITHVLEHLIDPVAVIKHLRDLLTPTGRLFLAVPNGNAASRMIAVKMGVLSHLGDLSAADVEAGHRRVYQLDTLCKDAIDGGLKIAQSGGIFFKPLANFQLNALMGGDLISDDFMEGCYQLGKEWPHLCASIYAIGEPA